jgi:hypothetical protein
MPNYGVMEEGDTLRLRVGAPVPEPALPALVDDKAGRVAKSKRVKASHESFFSKVFKAKSCVVCGEPIGFFSSKHTNCGVTAARVAEIISEQIGRYLEQGDASYIGKESIYALAVQGNLSDTEVKSAVQQGFECAVRNILSQRVLSREDEGRLSQLMGDWDFQKSEFCRGWPRMIQSFVIRDLLEGKVPEHSKALNSPVSLGKTESCVWVFSGVDIYQRKVRRSYEGHHAGLSVRIAKGTYLRHGVYRGHPVEHVSADRLGRGDLVLTTKNAFFLIEGETKKLSLKKIVSVNPHSDGMTFQCGGKGGSQYSVRRLDPWFAYNVMVNLSCLD